MPPIVTVVIPFYNDPYIDHAISSVLAQTYEAIEVIVVDDGSTEYQYKIDPYRSRIVYLGKANGGTASALNHGMTRASGKYVVWLSSDDAFYPDKIANQVAFMESHHLQFSFTDYHTINEYGSIVQPNSQFAFPSEKALVSAMLSYCPINGCTVMMLRNLIEAVGWFNPDLPYTHDYDLWARIAINGVHMGYLNQPLTLYRRHSGMGTVRHIDRITPEFEMMRAYYEPMLRQRLAGMPG
ncbi:glycosyl transferase [Paenibacillus yonginensis]|uniref:Glycosyl transferase n=2 Tax=Paenibacillus TaxID=44249 RepID=A0A1B1MWA5_9BACL|nr:MULTISPECIES: glycosyltransferase family A protein [Paenibacillus]ANS73454.1 glycosyl transferase [Paenibacillus yonginensis]GGA28042.1 glycosyl transferase family 2 [Paenibacillus physcomitrellae]